MRAFLVLALLSILLEMCQGKHVGQLPNDGVLTKENAALENLPPLFLKRFYDGQSYDGFVGLMGRRMAGTKEIPPALKHTSAALNKGAAKKKGFSAPIKCKLGSI
ncbi:tachykinin-3a isoform X2 [Stegostoma tigrinum]|uniref:tachykinin-3a isoform X2 n=1 Tax=Stegostoma tigrinum TaxID=3053191 RepID=UPI00286FD26B|nr:tachykinin-3a isoform X2 [Stegostoma tigrinum]